MSPKKTSEYVIVAGKKRVVYQGPRGGKYIKKAGSFVSIKKLQSGGGCMRLGDCKDEYNLPEQAWGKRCKGDWYRDDACEEKYVQIQDGNPEKEWQLCCQ
jgi:hypothetical protein